MVRGAFIFLATCAVLTGTAGCDASDESGVSDTDTGGRPDSGTISGDAGSAWDTADDTDTAEDADADTAAVESCFFNYESLFAEESAVARESIPKSSEHAAVRAVKNAPAEPAAPYTYTRQHAALSENADMVLPGYDDDMPLFERGVAWTEKTRCYELPYGARQLTQDQAYDLYRDIAEITTGVLMETQTEVRTVIGIRGSYPGTFEWNGNAPDLFNDTMVLLWVDEAGGRNVRELAGHTDVGAYDFGFESSSFLLPNRCYRYVNGQHGDNPYSALRIDESSYPVMNDTNTNGHWDDDRNGRLPPEGDDYLRTGFGHNIHVGSVNGPLGTAHVGVWSAGCQLIAGMSNWEEFINAAWTVEGDSVSYFLVDARDIPPAVWTTPVPAQASRSGIEE